MIKIQELRIGSLLDVDGNIIKVGKIEEDSISWNIAKDTAKFKIWNPFLPISDKRINPIPLTEEILLKFGFLKDGNVYRNILKNRLYVDMTNPIAIYFGNYNGILVMLDYAHQLQNIYFSLTNTELTWNGEI